MKNLFTHTCAAGNSDNHSVAGASKMRKSFSRTLEWAMSERSRVRARGEPSAAEGEDRRPGKRHVFGNKLTSTVNRFAETAKTCG